MEQMVEERTKNWRAEEHKRLEAEQWAYLGKIAGSLAHRIGNKGGMIRLCVLDLDEYFERIGLRDDWIQDQLHTIMRSNQYLLSLADFLFKPQKATTERMEKSDVLHYLEDALRYADVPKEVEISLSHAEHLPLICGNKYLVEAFLELIANAIDAMQSSPERKLSISVIAEGSLVEIHFTDTGPGMPTEDEELAFELFARGTDKKLSEEGHHQGFGLWWVRTFLRNINGDVWYKSLPGKGTTFFVRLPAAEGNDEQ
jgi:signal transduction histidine kinase